MKVTIEKNMTEQKAAATELVEAGVDTIIARLLGTGRAILFSHAVEEARKVQANPAIAATEVPILASEATRRGITIPQMAVAVGNQLKKYNKGLATINTHKETTLAQVTAATIPADLQFVYDIDWEQKYQQAKNLMV